MKVILSGATGSIGGGVLKRLLAEDGVSSIIVLSRRELDVKNDKLRTIIVEDFLKYKPEVLDQLKGAAACIWSVGLLAEFSKSTKRVVQVRLISLPGR